MKKFAFTLEKLHQVREIRQEKENLQLAKLRSEAERAADRVAQIEATRQEAFSSYARRLSAGEAVSAVEMELNSNHFASLNRLQRDAEKELAAKNAECDQQVTTVTEAMRDVKTTGNLRETQFSRHQLEYLREEQNTVDEIVSTAFARRIIQAK